LPILVLTPDDDSVGVETCRVIDLIKT
jgi:hypothetical protein